MNKKIFIVCPYGLVTGGPDALHQLVYYLNKSGFNAFLVYSDIIKKTKKIPEAYQCYIDNYLVLNEIEDDENNVIVVPETLTNMLYNFHHINKKVWWLSVDNDTNSAGKINKIKKIIKKLSNKKTYTQLYKVRTLKNFLSHKKFDFSDKTIHHLCASYYAFDYVSKRVTVEMVSLCIEPISKFFLDNIVKNKKENFIIYNPKKNLQYTKKIMKNKNMKSYRFVPLCGYNQSELEQIYSRAKIYIDFGGFPGAERIPKEAVLNNCIIITGRNGASNFYKDVPILEEYKFASLEENIEKICDRIRVSMENYDNEISNFLIYKNMVLDLEKNFIEQIKKIFKEICK